jgi:hypothetical protein
MHENPKTLPGDHLPFRPPPNRFGGGYSLVPHNYRSSTITNKDIHSLVCGRAIDQHNTSSRSLKFKSENDSGHINACILKRILKAFYVKSILNLLCRRK